MSSASSVKKMCVVGLMVRTHKSRPEQQIEFGGIHEN